jgi:alpha-D-ribose 1-methylphosphonate 5-triphosphate synthase subunit PhnG
MAFYTMIGFIAVAAVIGVGAYWVISNITFKRQSVRYTYKVDEAGNEFVQDNSKDEQNAPKA